MSSPASPRPSVGDDAGGLPPVRVLLLATVIFSLGALVSVPLVRAVVVLPLALLVPGYAVVLALFRRAPLGAAPLLALVLLLSMAFYPLLALALHGVGLPLSSWTVLAGTDTVVLVLAALPHLLPPTRAMVSFVRRTGTVLRNNPLIISAPRAMVSFVRRTGTGVRRASPGPREDAPPSLHAPLASPDGARIGAPDSSLQREGSRVALWGAGAAVTLICAGCGVLGATHALPTSPMSRDTPYTAFYLSGRWSRLAVVRAVPGHRLTVAAGVANDTGRRQVYRLSPLLDNAHWRAYTIAVPAGATWTGTVSGRIPTTGCLHRLSLTLHQRGARSPLRPLVLWVHTAARTPRACAGRA